MARQQSGYVTGWCAGAPAGHRADAVRCWGGATGVVYEAGAGRPAVVCHCPEDCHKRAAAELAAGAQLELVPVRARDKPEGVTV